MVTGMIYKIACNETNEVYYGSTIQKHLYERISQHKSKFKYWKEGKYHYVTSFQIIERGNYSYSLIEKVECENKKQLEQRERYYIENNDCINRCIVGRTDKEYREDNKLEIKENSKKYYEENKDKINTYKAKWYQLNRDRILIKKKQEYQGKQ